MASLVSIPAELLDRILSQLWGDDLLSICKSCKYLYSKAHYLLFRQITISWDVSAAPDKPPMIISLFEFILRNPDYAQCIKEIVILRLGYDNLAVLSRRWQNQDNQSPLRWLHWGTNLSLATLVRNVIAELYLPNPNGWYQAVVVGVNFEAIIALLLAQCTHIESLTINLDDITPTTYRWLSLSGPFFSEMIKHAAFAPRESTRLSRFEKLTMFHISTPNSTYRRLLELSTDVLNFCFYLPNITHLCIHHSPDQPIIVEGDVRSEPPSDSLWPLLDDSLLSTLTNLYLIETLAPARTIELLLSRTPNLQTLVYTCRVPIGNWLILPHLQSALDRVRDTLKYLTIRFDPGGRLPMRTLVLGSLGSLSGLAALEDLNISIGVLYGQAVAREGAPPLAAVLPATLRRLTINDDLWKALESIEWRGDFTEELLKAFFDGAWRSATPLLEEFVFDMRANGWSSLHWARLEVREELQQLVESQGIKCSILWDAPAPI